jgi:DNA-binding NarL/FixJ family response regulator
MAIKVMITDDHPVVRNGLANILNALDDIEVIGSYETGKELLEAMETLRPDVLILDMQLPDLQGPFLAQTVLQHHNDVKIIVLSSFDVIVQVKKMLKLGCMGYLLKDSDEATIIEAIHTVHGGGQYLSPRLANELIQDSFKNNRKTTVVLSRREKEVLQLIIEEFTNKEIANFS